MSTGFGFIAQIGFSRHGHLPQTIVALVRQSPGGLTAAELGQRLRLDPRSFLWQFHQHPGLQREKHQGHYVYFATDPTVADRQKTVRSAALAPVSLPSAEETIAVLVQAMQHPERSPEQLATAAAFALSPLDRRGHRRLVCPPPPDAKKNATSAWLDCLNDCRQQLREQTTSAALFPQPPVIDFTDPPPPAPTGAAVPGRCSKPTRAR